MFGRTSAKALGMALLIAVGVMAVSASAAQAKWLLLKNKVSVSQLDLKGEVLLSEKLVASLGLKTHCNKGTASVTLSLNGSSTVLSKSYGIIFLECKVLEFEKTCTVKSPGAAAGEIKISGSGEAKMEGEAVYFESSSTEFTTINIEGALCPLSESGGQKLNGSLKFTVDEALVDAATKLVLLDEKALFYGSEKTIYHGELLTPGVLDPAVLMHLKEASGSTWAIHLVGL